MAIHSNKLLWLMWLRLKLLLRGNGSTRALLLSLSLFLLPFGAAIAILLFSLFHKINIPLKTEGMYLVFTALLLVWMIMPLLSFSTSKGLDVSKLQLFPLTRLEVLTGLLFSSLFGWGTFLLAMIIGAVAADWWSASPELGLMVVLVSLVFYLVMVSISQAIIALLMRTLQSRHFRDLSVIIIALFSTSCALLRLLALKFSGIFNFGYAMQHQMFSPYLQWLPSGIAASSIRYAAQGKWSAAFAMLGLMLVICMVVLYLWNVLLERSLTASESGARRVRRARATTPIASSVAFANSRIGTALSGSDHVRTLCKPTQESRKRPLIFEQLLALMRKELRYFWREPLLKTRIFQRCISMLFLLLLPVLNSKSATAGASTLSYLPFASMIIVFLLVLMFSQNTLGMEQQSLQSLLLFPIDRRRLLWGKNLALLVLGLIALIALLIVCAIEGQRLNTLLPAAVIGLAGLGVTLGMGNITSTFFPRYQPRWGQRGITAANSGQMQSGGCLNALMALAMTVVTFVVLAPVALGTILLLNWHMEWIWLAAIPLSLVYSAALYIVLTNVAAKRLLATEPEILKIVTRE